MKKGQVQIIFTWIFILILIGVILIYGVKTIKKTVNLGEDTIISNFFKELDNKFKLYYSLDIESTSVEEFKLTSKVKYVCFIKDNNIPIEVREYEDYLKNLKDYSNVFVIPPVGKENRIKIDELYLDTNECLDVKGGVLKIRLTTTKDGVRVE